MLDFCVFSVLLGWIVKRCDFGVFFSFRTIAMHKIVEEPAPKLEIPVTPHLNDFLARFSFLFFFSFKFFNSLLTQPPDA